MAQIKLSEGIISALATRELGADDIQPVLQVIDVRSISSQKENAAERFRLLLSDGTHFQKGMLATQHNNLVRSGALKIGSIIKLLQFVCNSVQDRMIIVIINVEMVLDNCDIIDDPTPYPYLYKADENAPLVEGGVGMPSQSMNQPAAGSSIRPTYGGSPVANSVPRPNVGGSQYPMANSAPRPTVGGNPYGGGSAVPTYQKAEYGSGVSQAPANNYTRPSMSYINQPPQSSYNQRPPSSYNQRPPSTYNQPPPMYANRGPVAKNEAAPRIIPISALNVYQGRWTIKARVTVKTKLRTYHNAKGDGQVFSFDLLDSEGGEIKVTCFNDVAGQFYNVIEQGRVYMISKGTIKHAQKQFNHLPNEYEILLDNASTVQPFIEDDTSIPEQQFHFRPISDIEGLDKGSVLDVIGVVTSIDQTKTIMRKDDTETQKRTLQMKDKSGRSVEITMWGNFCNAEGSTLQNLCDSGSSPILALKSGRVNDFNGKSVGTIANSQLFINPDFPEAQGLKVWFDCEGKITPAVSLSRESNLVRTDDRKVISQIKDEKLGTSDKPDWITVSATLTFIKSENFCYAACPIEINGKQCNKKVTDNGDGKYKCERCEQEVDKCDYRYILQMQIQDHTGLTWVTAFQESGFEIMGIPAEELHNLKHGEQGDEGFNELVKNVLFTKFIFKLKVKEEIFNDESRVKSTVVKAEKLKFQTETKFLVDSISKLEQGYSGSLPQPKLENTISAPTGGGFGTGNRETPTPAVNHSGITSNVTRDSSQVGSYGKNQSTGSNFVSTGSTNYTNCISCGGTGHNSVNCPSLMPAPKQSHGSEFGNNTSPGPSVGGVSGECYKCHQNGHWARDCPGTGNVPLAYGSGNVGPGFGDNASHGSAAGECYKCHQHGHWAKDCPANVPPTYGSGNVGAGFGNNASHGSAVGECYKCHQQGHWAKDCAANVPPAYGSGNVRPGRYGMVPNQRAGL